MLLYQVHLFHVFVVFHLLFSTYIDVYSKPVFPRGFLSRFMLTKNTYVHFHVCYSLEQRCFNSSDREECYIFYGIHVLTYW
jgi:hypothetical protein